MTTRPQGTGDDNDEDDGTDEEDEAMADGLEQLMQGMGGAGGGMPDPAQLGQLLQQVRPVSWPRSACQNSRTSEIGHAPPGHGRGHGRWPVGHRELPPPDRGPLRAADRRAPAGAAGRAAAGDYASSASRLCELRQLSARPLLQATGLNAEQLQQLQQMAVRSFAQPALYLRFTPIRLAYGHHALSHSRMFCG